MNIIFAGTPEFSAVILQGLIDSSHKIKAVYTQPDRPAGRGQKLTESPVKQLAFAHHLPVYQPSTLRDESEQQRIADLKADVMIVVVYSLLIPPQILRAMRFGCINIHPSLLPRWRGAAPVHRAILAGDTKSGITIMQLDEGWDTGPLLYKIECPILPKDTAETLNNRLAVLGREAILVTLDQLSQLKPEPQDNLLATHANKITKEEGRLNWNLSAVELERKVRAFNPWPIAYCQSGETIIRVWEAEVIEKDTAYIVPGKIIQTSAEGIDVATGENVLRLIKLQLPGRRVLTAKDILNAHRGEFAVGNIFL
jgi:methionyl-tRNA formyltransferase